jgi:hypothetical protein
MKTLILLCLSVFTIRPNVTENHLAKMPVYMDATSKSYTLNGLLKPQIPSKTFTWSEMTAGDCVLGNGSTVTVWADGNIKFSGVVWTNHTHSGDQWHHVITFQDYRGITLFSVRFDGPGHMNDDGSRYNFGPAWQKYDARFFDMIAQATASGAC